MPADVFPQEYPLMGGLSTDHTWRVRVRYANNPAGPLRGIEFVESVTMPQHGGYIRTMFGRATIQSKRPRQVSPGLTRRELQD